MTVCPRAVIFDLDDTLAESFQPPVPEMISKLRALLEHTPLAIMTAAGFPRIEDQFLTELADSPHISRLYVFPNSTAECYLSLNSAWKLAYSLALTVEERTKIKTAIEESIKETGVIEDHPQYKPEIIDRDAQIAFAARGLKAPLAEKKAWDPDQQKRKKLKDALDRRIPEFEVLIGGMTTIDITHKSVNKSYGVAWLSKHLDIPTSEMLYVGDALYEGGNDSVVIPTGIQTRPVANPSETLLVADELLKTCGAN